jgi:folate-dependent phosphoribosylglycinamide formyltransferase PurN
MTVLPLTVLVSEGPIARAYLARLRLAGLAPEGIVLMVRRRHPTRGTVLGRWLPPRLRVAWAQRHQEAAYGHWPREIRRRHPALVNALVQALAAITPEAETVVDEILARPEYDTYAANVERLVVDDLADPALASHLAAAAPATVLYTGGGIVPRSLLALPATRFLHVHPGCLPHVRGADGLLWSMLVRGRPGASCFWMAEGIDTGDVIAARELPAVVCPVPDGERPDDQTLYRALFSFWDPLLRAELLATVLADAGGSLSAMRATPQDASEGMSYHFMHPRLRAAALRRVFPSASEEAFAMARDALRALRASRTKLLRKYAMSRRSSA